MTAHPAVSPRRRGRRDRAVAGLRPDATLERPAPGHRHQARRTQPELFLVGTMDETVHGQRDGELRRHRGWIYYLAVDPAAPARRHGRALMHEAERLLLERGCPKLNLQVRTSNVEVIDFYRDSAITVEERTSLGRRFLRGRRIRGARRAPSASREAIAPSTSVPRHHAQRTPAVRRPSCSWRTSARRRRRRPPAGQATARLVARAARRCMRRLRRRDFDDAYLERSRDLLGRDIEAAASGASRPSMPTSSRMPPG